MLDSNLAAPQGFEPRYADPESAVPDNVACPFSVGARRDISIRLPTLPFVELAEVKLSDVSVRG